jgi:hypothetical protein
MNQKLIWIKEGIAMETIEFYEYPRAIADVQQEILHVTQLLRQHREGVMFCLNAIDRVIAFDNDLKNDTQRKTKRAYLMETDPDYIKASNEVKRLEDLKGELDIDLQLYRDTFSVLRLNRREEIARLELQATAA